MSSKTLNNNFVLKKTSFTLAEMLGQLYWLYYVSDSEIGISSNLSQQIETLKVGISSSTPTSTEFTDNQLYAISRKRILESVVSCMDVRYKKLAWLLVHPEQPEMCFKIVFGIYGKIFQECIPNAKEMCLKRIANIETPEESNNILNTKMRVERDVLLTLREFNNSYFNIHKDQVKTLNLVNRKGYKQND